MLGALMAVMQVLRADEPVESRFEQLRPEENPPSGCVNSGTSQ